MTWYLALAGSAVFLTFSFAFLFRSSIVTSLSGKVFFKNSIVDVYQSYFKLIFDMAHAAATAAVNAKAAAALVKVLRQKNNENTAKFFAAGMAGIILISWILHWTGVAFKHHEVKVGQEVGILKSPVAISRYHHSHCLNKHPLIA
jgi:hypothetical protein